MVFQGAEKAKIIGSRCSGKRNEPLRLSPSVVLNAEFGAYNLRASMKMMTQAILVYGRRFYPFASTREKDISESNYCMR
jgi:hypothetical protein